MKTRAPVSAVQINNRDSQRDDGRISPQAGIVYELSDPVVLYAAYGEGFRANIGTDVNGDIFMPEETRSIEAGAKLSLLGGAISGTLAVFNLDKENVLASDIRACCRFMRARVGVRKSCPARRESPSRGVPRSRLATPQGAICGPTLRDKRCFAATQRSSPLAQNDCAA